MPFRVGCVPYLNALPLVGAADSELEVVYDVPSELPRRLESGEVDAILVSSIEALRRPNAKVVQGIGIASRNEVLSVRLFAKVPLADVQTLALDRSSMTSNALATILLREIFGVQPKGVPQPPDLDRMLAEHDAALLIGDNGMRAPGLPEPHGQTSDLHILDLGHAWRSLTGLPFVWALWLGREDLHPELSDILKSTAQRGLANLDALIKVGIDRFGFSASLTTDYLSSVMEYELGTDHLRALDRYARYLGLDPLPSDAWISAEPVQA